MLLIYLRIWIAQWAIPIPEALIQSCNPFLEASTWCTHRGCARGACLITFWAFICSGQQPVWWGTDERPNPDIYCFPSPSNETYMCIFKSPFHLQTSARVWSFISLQWNQITGGVFRNKMDDCSWQSAQEKASNHTVKGMPNSQVFQIRCLSNFYETYIKSYY